MGVAVVTGSRKGIGRAISERLLERGYLVYGCSRNDSDLRHRNYKHVCADVADEEQIRQMSRMIRSESGNIDVLVNNAGIASMNHSMLMPIDQVANVVKTNLIGTFNCSAQFARLLRGATNGGRIVNFSTVAVPLHLEGEAAYAASKAGIEELTKVMSREYAPYGITCNAVGPTPVDTDLIASVGEDRLARLKERQAIKHFATFDDIWNVVGFFISKDSAMITGQVIYLGGVC